MPCESTSGFRSERKPQVVSVSVDRFQTWAGEPILVVVMVSLYAASSAGTLNAPYG